MYVERFEFIVSLLFNVLSSPLPSLLLLSLLWCRSSLLCYFCGCHCSGSSRNCLLLNLIMHSLFNIVHIRERQRKRAVHGEGAGQEDGESCTIFLNAFNYYRIVVKYSVHLPCYGMVCLLALFGVWLDGDRILLQVHTKSRTNIPNR